MLVFYSILMLSLVGLYVSMIYFLLQTTFLPFCFVSFFDSMDYGILCSKVLILQ
jgi:hypothetical protein